MDAFLAQVFFALIADTFWLKSAEIDFIEFENGRIISSGVLNLLELVWR